MLVDKSVILEIFEQLNTNEIEYVLLRNMANELPSNFEANKDIDILIRKESKEKFKNLMKSLGWKQIKHPWDFGNNFIFLYAMDKLEFYDKNNIHLDICYQLCCRSINQGEWMPVDQLIQDSVWNKRIKNDEWGWYQMCNEDQLLHLLTRCVFDKKTFNTDYISEIKRLISIVDEKALFERLNVVFFKFSPVLIQMIQDERFEDIVKAYLTFTSY